MFYTVYKTTNLINSKIYVGLHVTSNLEDDYLGSGSQLKSAIKKYGKENFKREYIKICNSPEEMYELEADIVNEDFVKRSDTYNMKTGGTGSWYHVNVNKEAKHESSSRGGKIRARRDDNPFKDPEFQKTVEWTRAPDRMRMLGQKANTPEVNEKRKNTFKKIKHQAGNANSQFGRIWISNVLTKEVKRITISDTIPEGWVRGKKGYIPTKLWVNNGVKEHYILLEKEQEYKLKGFSSGRLKSSMLRSRIVV